MVARKSGRRDLGAVCVDTASGTGRPGVKAGLCDPGQITCPLRPLFPIWRVEMLLLREWHEHAQGALHWQTHSESRRGCGSDCGPPGA